MYAAEETSMTSIGSVGHAYIPRYNKDYEEGIV